MASPNTFKAECARIGHALTFKVDHSNGADHVGIAIKSAICAYTVGANENKTRFLKSQKSPENWGFKWSGREDLNLRPPRPERGALPGCATPRQW